MGKIYKIPLGYRILRLYSNNFYGHWFSTIEVNGHENIPEDASVIFAPNHQNAFTDAMALLSTSPEPVIFLARADLFKKSLLNKILRWLRIMPAYRMRDGIQNLKKNAESFDEAVRVLMHKEYFCLMPEGGQDEKRKLRPLVKGMFRIGFSAQSQYGETDTVWIVPTGIDYGNYDHSGSHLIMNFGKPISMKDYYAMYEENAPVAQNKIRDELYSRMAPLMLNIRTDEYYDAIYTSAYICNLEQLNSQNWDDNETNRLIARQQIVKSLDRAAANEANKKDFDELATLAKQWTELHSNIELTARTMECGKQFDGAMLSSIIYAVVGLIPAAYSMALNWPVAAFIKWGNNKWGAEGFYSSVSLAASMVFFPIWHLILAIAGGINVYNYFGLITTVCFLVSLPMSVFFLLRYYWNTKYLYHRLKNTFGNDTLTEKIKEKVQQITKLWHED